METTTLHEDTPFAKIGGINALHELVERFYDKIMADKTVSYFFYRTDMEQQRAKMKAFLMMALGGPVNFTGKEIRAAHVKLVERGLTDVHFDAVGNHLSASLSELQIEEEVKGQILQVVESIRGEVLNK